MSAPAAFASSALVAAGEHRDARRAAGAVRQVGDAAHHLVGVARIDAEIERDLDRLVELRDRPLLHHLHRISERIELLAVDAVADLAVALARLAHATTSIPIERAEPSTIRIAASTSRAFRSFSFCSAIERT